MKPRAVDYLLGSRYTVPLWLLAGLWLYLEIAPLWERFAPEEQLALALSSGAYGLAILISAIKVLPYEQAVRRQGAIGRTPEQIAQHRRRQKPLLLLLACGGGIAGFSWLLEHPLTDNELNSYALLTCFLFAVLPLLFATTKVASRVRALLRRVRLAVPEKPFIVQWCQPVPKQAATADQIHAELPGYCRLLLTAAKPPEQPPGFPIYHPSSSRPVYH